MIPTVRSSRDWPKILPALFFCALIPCGAQVTSGQQQIETPQQTNAKIQELASLARTAPRDTAVGTGDLLHVDVFDVPELSRDVRVGETGEIGYPLIPGRIQVNGLTTFQIEQKLEQLLIENGLVTHPQVSVSVREQTSQPLTVVGAVARPMVYQVVRRTTLLEILAQAGGITDNAGSEIMVIRSSAPEDAKAEADTALPDNHQPTPVSELGSQSPTITIRLQDLLESGNPVFNIPVLGGDVVSVPRAGIVYVLGAGISQPGGYVLQGHGDQVTVLRAVALAHGMTNFAKSNDAVILRNNPSTGQRVVIPVRIKEMENHKSEDVALSSNDILYIPDSVGKKALIRGTESALSIGTGVALYKAY
jgi:polysaccharide export outer membrane protein